MELNQETKQAVRELGDAINKAVEQSARVSKAIETLREMGFEPHLSLKLEIALQEIYRDAMADENQNLEYELTDDDIQILRRMKIKF